MHVTFSLFRCTLEPVARVWMSERPIRQHPQLHAGPLTDVTAIIMILPSSQQVSRPVPLRRSVMRCGQARTSSAQTSQAITTYTQRTLHTYVVLCPLADSNDFVLWTASRHTLLNSE